MKTTLLSRSVKQLTDNVHLAASAQSTYVVWIGGIPQSTVYLPHPDKFYWLPIHFTFIHTQHRMIEATRRDKNGVLQNVPWSFGCSLSDVMSASCRSPNQPIRCNQKRRRVFLKITSQTENRIFKLFAKYIWSVWPNFLPLCEASWTVYEVVWRAGFRVRYIRL